MSEFLFAAVKGQPAHWLRDLSPEELARWRKARADYEALVRRSQELAEPGKKEGAVIPAP